MCPKIIFLIGQADHFTYGVTAKAGTEKAGIVKDGTIKGGTVKDGTMKDGSVHMPRIWQNLRSWRKQEEFEMMYGAR